MASVQEMAATIKRQQKRIEELEGEVEKLSGMLDRAQSVLNFQNAPESERGGGDQKVSRQRGIGISAEPTQQNALMDIKLVRYPKNEAQKQQIEQAIVANDFLNKLDRQQIADLVECMSPRSCRRNDMIITEGDVGNELYVIEVGEVDVFRGSGEVIRTMKPGQLFGELAILYNCTRTASIKAKTDGRLWVIERKVFQNIMMKTTLKKQQLYIQVLKQVPSFASLPEETLKALSDTMEERMYKPGEFMILHGAHGNRCYMITSGECELQYLDSSKPPSLLGPGKYFADETLQERGECRIENAVAKGKLPCVCLLVYKEAFQQIVNAKREHIDDQRAVTESKAVSDEFDRAHLCSDDFEYVATLGVGGFGRVELVRYRHGSSLKTYAMKTLKKRHIVETRQQEHVLNEKNIMLSCNSPFIVQLFATFKDPKYLYMVFEACLGGELWTILRDYSHFDDGTTRFYTACVVEAFQYLHSKGIIYRDLKPENLLLDASGYAKMCDFGFSKVIGNSKTWTFCGTPEYVPPEIILNKGHDFSADYWSLGILMFELLTGNPPFVGSDPMKTYNIILKGIDMIHFPSKKISRSANQLIRRLCKPNPAERLGVQKGGIKEIKKNKWFEGFNWEGLAQRRLHPPILKAIASPVDMSNFDKYERTVEQPPPDDFTGWDKDF